MSIANIVRSGSKNQKTSGNVQIPQNCTFPEVFQVFHPLAIIFAMDIYIFLESACQAAADGPIKTPKSWTLFFDPMRASKIFQCKCGTPKHFQKLKKIIFPGYIWYEATILGPHQWSHAKCNFHTCLLLMFQAYQMFLNFIGLQIAQLL